ncbi:MAG TPA: DUF3341 domain-containing protein [Gemmatimonadaceae bacterium]|jgi:hypothetical protein
MQLLPNPPRSPSLLAEFLQPESLLAAIEALRRESYHGLEAFTPYDIPDLDRVLDLRRPKIGRLAAIGGGCGLVASYGIQWWANVYAYPLNSGGRPVHAAPAFMLATFEGTIAGAALSAFLGLFVLLRYPRPWAPEDEVEGFHRATIDRFWLGMQTFASERDRDHAITLLERHGALRTVKLGGA